MQIEDLKISWCDQQYADYVSPSINLSLFSHLDLTK